MTILPSNPSTPQRHTCPHCGERYDGAVPFVPASHQFLRYKVGNDTYVETCEKILGEFISRSMNSRYVDEDGNPK